MNKYLENVRKGKNTWYSYVFTILSVIVGISIGSLILGLITPFLKDVFPKGDLGKELGTFVIIGGIFGFGLIAFIIAFKKFHQRSVFSLLGITNKFNFALYFKGFILWGVLLFIASLITEFHLFQKFLFNFNLSNFILLAVVGFVFLGIQTFFEEILIRAYILQGISLKIKNVFLLIIVNSILFGIMHFGYGLDSFLYNSIVGVTFVLIVLKHKQIEFVSGAHNANNLILSLIFIDLNDALNKDFTWSIDWGFLPLHILISTLLIIIVYKFIK